MNKPQAVLFDLDGTLLDSAPDFLLVINNMLAARSAAPLSLDQLRYQVSNGARAMVRFAFGEVSEAAFEALKQEFLDSYLKVINQRSLLYPGIVELLNDLQQQDIRWGIVTNKPERYTTPIVEHFGWRSHAAAVICPDHVKHTKPNPEPLLLACQQMGVLPENCWYLGDHLRDIEAGNAANMYSIGCRYGYLNENEDPDLWRADQLISSPLEIIDKIKAAN